VTEQTAPVVLYELNEVPWRVIDWYVERRPKSCLAATVACAQTFTSITHDTGELHPWVTWPTLHRSVYNSAHGIGFINQDLSHATAYPPLWEKIARAGKSVGIFGSLQSYPPPTDGTYAFYVPDTFAAGPETLPPRYACFQRLNLRQTSTDRGGAKEVSATKDTIKDLFALVQNGLTAKTVARLGAQLVSERVDPIHRTRRPMLQAPVAFDVFRHALQRSTPDFCTFFTNHVAGIMHRYWKYAFPEDFGYVLSGKTDHFHVESLLIAMDYADEQLAYLRSWIERRHGILYVASSMGQEAIEREQEDEVFIDDMDRFLQRLRFSGDVESRMAMHPDYSFALKDETDAATFAGVLRILQRKDRKPAFFNIDVAGTTVGAAIGSGSGFGLQEDEGFIYLPGDGEREVVPFKDLGLKAMRRDVGTGYHQPLGSLIRFGNGVAANPDRTKIETIAIAAMIMSDLRLEQGALECATSVEPASARRPTQSSPASQVMCSDNGQRYGARQ